jgi:DNA-binding protein
MDGEKQVSRKTGKDDNTVFIGKKGVMSYVLAVVTQFNNGAQEVIVKARGRAISRAVDVAEIVRQRFVTEAQLGDIKISTEEIQGDEGPIKVSAIEIVLTK